MAAAASGTDHEEPRKRRSSLEFLLPSMCELRVVLLGNSWPLRRQVGNLLLGETVFDEAPGQCLRVSRPTEEKKMVVIITPDLLHPNVSEDKLTQLVEHCAPGPHVFLLVLQPEDLTEPQSERLHSVLQRFGDQSFARSLALISASGVESDLQRRSHLINSSEKFTIILLTGKNKLENDQLSIDEYMMKGHDSFKKLIADCGGRLHAFNNRDKQNRKQVTELMNKIDTMVKKNGGNCFTNQMLQEAEAAIKKEVERILKEKEEEMQREKEELERKLKITTEQQTAQIEHERKLRDKELKDLMENIDREHAERKNEQEKREAEEKQRKIQQEHQQKQWEEKLEALEKQIKSESELEEHREAIRKEQEEWEKKQRDWWEKRKLEDEQRQKKEKKLKDLAEQYAQEKEESERKRKEEDQIRNQQEQKERKELEETYKMKLENMRKTYEEEARRKAEEHNEFNVKYRNDLATMKQKHETHLKDKDEKYDLLKALSLYNTQQHKKDINDFVRCVSKNSKNLENIKDLLTRHEDQMKKATDRGEKENLQKIHQREMSDLIQDLLDKTETKASCSIFVR